MSKKGTSSEDALSSQKLNPSGVYCMLGQKTMENYIAFSDVKVYAAVKLSSLHQIRDMRLAESNDSPNRM